MAWTKLHREIVTSSIWGEPYHVRVVWVSMLAYCDADGVVQASLPGLARIANVTRDEAHNAIQRFLAPDPDSRTPDNDGRRVEVVAGGWRVMNYSLYRARHLSEEERAAARQRMKALRERRKVSPTPPSDTKKDTEAEAEAEAENVTLVRHVTHEHASNTEMETEPPKGFPRTEQEASDSASFAGCPPEFAVTTWTRCASRGWRDAKDVPVRSWRHYLASMWTYETNRKAERRNGHHDTDRTRGMRNELDEINRKLMSMTNPETRAKYEAKREELRKALA